MDQEATNMDQSKQAETNVDPWVSAFAALEQKGNETPEAATGDNAGSSEDAKDANGANGTDDAPERGEQSQDDTGGLDNDAKVLPEDDAGNQGRSFPVPQEVTEDSIKQYEENLDKDIRDQAIRDIAAEFANRGVRNHNGVLGAAIDDPDICKRDSDGVPRFYNPETGREFMGENPRRQAQEWVDDYNKELARLFNESCENYEQQLREQAQPSLEVMKFAPTYEGLDDIRKGMFDNIIQDYEIEDENGKVVGYSCDLNKALAQVERQITMIQNYAKSKMQETNNGQEEQPSGPALDMKTSSGAVPSGEQAMPKSLAEAMEQLQDKKLSQLDK